MKDTSLPIRKAYFSLITGLGYRVYDQKAPDAAQKPYIILGSQTSQSEGTKTSFDNRCTINLDLVDAYNDQFGGRKRLDEMVDVVLAAAIPQPGQTPITMTGFNIFSTKKIMDYDFNPTQNDTQTIFRRIITIEHLLEQL